MIKFWRFVPLVGLVVFSSVLFLLPKAHAQTAGSFSLQVTPSPLVVTVKPGQSTTLELKIRNASTSAEELKIEPRAFAFDSKSGQVRLQDVTPAEITSWVSFGAPKFSVQSGEWFTEQVKISLPKDSGFSYSFALVISRQKDVKLTESGRLIKGAVAIFTLVNVDRPGATRQLSVAEFSSSKHLYEYLPATLNITLKNTGNTIVQPYGNIFIQRDGNSKSPLATLPVNDSHGYILPGTKRTLSTQWQDGFWVYQITTNTDSSTHKHLTWNWNKLSDFRFGRYTAKLIAVYNDGQRDIPIQGEVSFWVVPWRAIILLIVTMCGLWWLQHWRVKRRTAKAVQKALSAAKKQEAKHEKIS